jgi:hypothetical protein
MVFQIFASGPHCCQKLSSAGFPDEPPVSRFQMPLSPEVDDVEDAGDANPCSVVGIDVTTCDSDWVAVPAEVDVAWATAADWPATPPAVVF